LAYHLLFRICLSHPWSGSWHHSADIITRSLNGYLLTERGKELRFFIVPQAKWSANWSKEVYGYERLGMNERIAQEQSAD
jgi:hypothetical protein